MLARTVRSVTRARWPGLPVKRIANQQARSLRTSRTSWYGKDDKHNNASNLASNKENVDISIDALFADVKKAGSSGELDSMGSDSKSLDDFFASISQETERNKEQREKEQSIGTSNQLNMDQLLASLSQAPKEARATGSKHAQSTERLFGLLFGEQNKGDGEETPYDAARRLDEAESAYLDESVALQKLSAVFAEEDFQGEDKMPLTQLQYWALYPSQVKKWLIYTRTPKGFYGDEGTWQTAWAQNKPRVPMPAEELAADTAYHQQMFEQEQRLLPEDLKGAYRFGIQPEELDGLHPKLHRIFSFRYATQAEINAFRKQMIIAKWGKHVADTGNDAVQIAILTQRINHLNEMLQKRVTDKDNEYRLNLMVQRRTALMKHLKRHDVPTYYALLKHINLRDQVEVF